MNKYIKILKISWSSALVLSLMILIITLILPLIISNFSETGHKNNIIGNYGFILIILALMLFTDKYEKRQIKKLKNQDLLTKLSKYKTIYTNQMVGYTLITVVCFVTILVTHFIGAIIFDIFAVLLIIAHRPMDVKVKFDLNLTQEELSKFNHIKFTTKSKEF